MACDVACCGRSAVVTVWFAHSTGPYGYCSWHAYRRGELRWSSRQVARTEKIRE